MVTLSAIQPIYRHSEKSRRKFFRGRRNRVVHGCTPGRKVSTRRTSHKTAYRTPLRSCSHTCRFSEVCRKYDRSRIGNIKAGGGVFDDLKYEDFRYEVDRNETFPLPRINLISFRAFRGQRNLVRTLSEVYNEHDHIGEMLSEPYPTKRVNGRVLVWGNSHLALQAHR